MRLIASYLVAKLVEMMGFFPKPIFPQLWQKTPFKECCTGSPYYDWDYFLMQHLSDGCIQLQCHNLIVAEHCLALQRKSSWPAVCVHPGMRDILRPWSAFLLSATSVLPLCISWCAHRTATRAHRSPCAARHCIFTSPQTLITYLRISSL